MVNIRIIGAASDSPALPPLPIVALAAALVNLLCEADGLPQPRYLTVSRSQYIDLLFPPVPASERAITRWALHFGGELWDDMHENEDGSIEHWCRLTFDYYGITVVAYAHVPVSPAPEGEKAR